MPALPQQSSCSAGSTSSTPGIERSSARGSRADPLGVRRGGRSPGRRRAAAAECSSGALPARERLGDVDHRQVELGVLQVRAAAGGVRDDRLGARRARTPRRRGAPARAPARGGRRAARARRSSRRRAPSPRSRTRASTRADARLTSPKSTLCTQPVSRPTRATRSPAAGVSRGGATGSRQRRRELRGRRGTARAARTAAQRASRAGAAAPRTRAPAAAARATGRGTSSSTRSRASSISRSYFTPDGHEVRQAMQPRQRSKCSATVAVQLDRPVERRLHQPDPAARRVHLLVPELVGRARRQAEAAVHAVVDQQRSRGPSRRAAPSGSKAARTRSASGDQASVARAGST